MIRRCSVLMSIYNETESQIRESVESILSQTLCDFEFIIVLDNPERKDVDAILDSYNDERIILIKNEKNIGLALSMNKAASKAHSDIFARMDADDIAAYDRLQKEYELLTSGNYDFVFSNYSLIDEQSKTLKSEYEKKMYKPVELPYIISLNASVIHHPTVMFTKTIFDKVGGYRNFPCSQDFDLWLRMQEAGCRFIQLSDNLLKYRVNSNSVTARKWFQQKLTILYIFELSIQRLKFGKDNYSLENYQLFLQENGVNSAILSERHRKAQQLLSKAYAARQRGDKVTSFLFRMIAFISCKLLRKHYLNTRLKKKLTRI